MKTLFFLISFFFTQMALAGEISFIGPCEEEPVLEYSFETEPLSVGDLTFDLLTENQIPFIGSPKGFNSILNSPYDKEAIEFIGDGELLAYGWCYSVDGVPPEDLPDAVNVSTGNKVLWWYGYAHYKQGEWLSQCEPSYKRRSPQFCPPEEEN